MAAWLPRFERKLVSPGDGSIPVPVLTHKASEAAGRRLDLKLLGISPIPEGLQPIAGVPGAQRGALRAEFEVGPGVFKFPLMIPITSDASGDWTFPDPVALAEQVRTEINKRAQNIRQAPQHTGPTEAERRRHSEAEQRSN